MASIITCQCVTRAWNHFAFLFGILQLLFMILYPLLMISDMIFCHSSNIESVDSGGKGRKPSEHL